MFFGANNCKMLFGVYTHKTFFDVTTWKHLQIVTDRHCYLFEDHLCEYLEDDFWCVLWPMV